MSITEYVIYNWYFPPLLFNSSKQIMFWYRTRKLCTVEINHNVNIAISLWSRFESNKEEGCLHLCLKFLLSETYCFINLMFNAHENKVLMLSGRKSFTRCRLRARLICNYCAWGAWSLTTIDVHLKHVKSFTQILMSER